MLLRRRHRQERISEVPIVEEQPEVKLEDMTVEQLRSYAEEKGIDLGKSTSHDGILKKIQEAEKVGDEPQTGADPATLTGDAEE